MLAGFTSHTLLKSGRRTNHRSHENREQGGDQMHRLPLMAVMLERVLDLYRHFAPYPLQ